MSRGKRDRQRVTTDRSKSQRQKQSLFGKLILLACLLGIFSNTTETRAEDFLFQSGSPGSGDEQFQYPFGIAVDGSGNICVTDYGNHRIQIFNGKGEFIRVFGTRGYNNGQFVYPLGIALDRSGNLYVSDYGGRVQVFTITGQFIRSWRISGGDMQPHPSGITIDQSGHVYVSDANNHCIQIYDSAGQFIRKWGVAGSEDGNLSGPSGIALDESGDLYVADAYNKRVQVFSSTGEFIRKWGADGMGAGQFSRPSGVALDGSGNVFVADTNNHRVQVFTGTGEFLRKWGNMGSGDGQFFCPYAIAVVGSGNIYVADTYNHRIQVFGSPNHPPVADAGENITILSNDQESLTIVGTASDHDGDPLTYRWMEGEVELSPWQAVEEGGAAPIDFGSAPAFEAGRHTLTLEIDDGSAISRDSMILTIENSAPNAVLSGAGTYQVNSPVILGGSVSDFDGDMISFEWFEAGNPLPIFGGFTQTTEGGYPVDLPSHVIIGLQVGTHVFSLQVSDGVNEPISQSIVVEVVDTAAPELAPVSDTMILWPPNHRMVEVAISANASDNSGGPVALSAVVSSNEPQDGNGDGDLYPDWSDAVIDDALGVIFIQLRAERSGRGSGREYTVSITATDESGNSSAAGLKILVPHDQRKK